MAIRPEVLRALEGAGATLNMILVAIEADRLAESRDREAALESKRAKDAERQRRHRKSRVVTPVTRDERDPSPKEKVPPHPPKNPTPNQLPPSPPTGAQTPAGGLFGKLANGHSHRSRGAPLPADWKPTAQHFAKALRQGRGRDWVEDQAEAMREWAEGNSNRQVARKADWNRTFDGWLRREMAKAQGPPRKQASAWVC